MTRLGILGAIAAIGLVSGSAIASPSAKLVYVRGAGAEACPGEADLRRAVAVRLGYDPFFPTATKTVVAEVSRGKNEYRGKMRIVGDDGNLRGERELATAGEDCTELVTAMALAVSLALDDLDAIERSEPPPPPPPANEVEGPPAPPPPREPAVVVVDKPAPPPRAPLELAASLGPTLAFGTSPSPALGGGVAATLRRAGLGARLDLRADAPAGGDVAPSGKVVTNAVVATITGCVGELPFVCIGGGGGWLFTRTEGISHTGSDSGLLVVAVVKLGADVPLGKIFYVEPFFDGIVDIVRHHVDIDGSQAYAMPALGGTGGIHLGGHFL